MNNRTHKVRNSIPRIIFVALAVLLQVAWLLMLVLRFNTYSNWIAAASTIIALVVVVRLYSKHTSPAFKLPWIMLIMALPVMGLALYLMVEVFSDLGSFRKRMAALVQQRQQRIPQNPEIPGKLDPDCAGYSRYLQQIGGAPVYENTAVTYYPEAVQAFEAMKRELEKAESFIFMEYFIVEDGSSFREILEILERKVKAGVEVRLMYDDLGSVGYVNLRFAKSLVDKGIRCQVFNPALPVVNLFMNHRDHRKITVIDGKVGFSGGYNLADEYFDRRRPYGKWKDTGVRLEGEAVRSLTAFFLEMWAASSGRPENFDTYLNISHSVPGTGFVQPFADDPQSRERLAENTYLHLIYNARDSLYIITPYLIITDEMVNALGLAARRGVDVRIITPGIPDKKTVYQVTRSYYGGLAEQGVRIFEYSPGFCHAKQCVCDGRYATIGTSNLDYRSFYHHFENDILLMDCDAVKQIEADFAQLFPQCREVTREYCSGKKHMLLFQCLLRLIAPLM